jgi:membrane-anchored glycerophosphoryl diester phosphodiesterase (GDPDase)
MSNRQYIQNAIENGYDFKIGDYFSRGWEYFKLKPLEYVGYATLVIVITLVLSIIPIIGTIASLIISPALTVGALIFTNMLARNENPEFGNFFDGFKKLTPLLVAYLLTLVIYAIIFIPFLLIVGVSVISEFAAAGDDPEAMVDNFQTLASMGIWIFIFALILLYVAVSLRWVLHLVYFHQYDAVEAIKTSWKLTNKKWLHHLGFVLLGGFFMFLGALALVVGILVAIPFFYAADLAGYADVTGLNAEDELDNLGQTEDTV